MLLRYRYSVKNKGLAALIIMVFLKKKKTLFGL